MNTMKKGSPIPKHCQCIICGTVSSPWDMADFGINGDMSKGICVECKKKPAEAEVKNEQHYTL